MLFDTCIFSESGGRPYNEDCCGQAEAAGKHCWVLADGLGGHGSGALAAKIAVESLVGQFEGAPSCLADRIGRYLEAANHAVVTGQDGDASSKSMHTTAVMIIGDGHRYAWGHVGDSRLYLFRGGRIFHQTLDHSVPQSLVSAGQMETKAIRFHEDRNRLLRSLGTHQALKPTVMEEAALQGDAFLLASDGFWEFVMETEMEVELARAATAEAWMNGMLSRLRGRAVPDRDNCSAITVIAN